MKIDIWSDVRCPFCYIGKHKFEKALYAFKQKEKIEIIWHSFELDSQLKTNPKISEYEYLSQHKGLTVEQVKQMSAQITKMGEEIGLTFHFDQTVTANSFDAHRLIQFAKEQGQGNEIEEALFQAHFTDGKNIDDIAILKKIGLSIGLQKETLDKVLDSDAYTDAVNEDKEKAQAMGISGVPFFIFNNKYAISGAQPTEAFAETLEKSWTEFEKNHPQLIVTEGPSCSADGHCE